MFDPFESIVMFFAGMYLLRLLKIRDQSELCLVLVVNYTVQDGRSNWLEGMILMCLYIILAVVFWYYPGTCLLFALFSPNQNGC